jgi:hypothetical protein
MLKPQFFAQSDGSLFRFDRTLSDAARTNQSAVSGRVIRENFSRHYRDIKTGAQLRATLRAGQYAWPGGYQLYFVTDDGAALSFASVRENLRQVLYSIRHKLNDGWRVIACESTEAADDIVTCEHSNEVIFDPAA